MEQSSQKTRNVLKNMFTLLQTHYYYYYYYIKRYTPIIFSADTRNLLYQRNTPINTPSPLINSDSDKARYTSRNLINSTHVSQSARARVPLMGQSRELGLSFTKGIKLSRGN